MNKPRMNHAVTRPALKAAAGAWIAGLAGALIVGGALLASAKAGAEPQAAVSGAERVVGHVTGAAEKVEGHVKRGLKAADRGIDRASAATGRAVSRTAERIGAPTERAEAAAARERSREAP